MPTIDEVQYALVNKTPGEEGKPYQQLGVKPSGLAGTYPYEITSTTVTYTEVTD